MNQLVRALCQQEGFVPQHVRPLSGGQINRVFLVDDRYIVRMGSGEGAYRRLKCETEIIQNLANQVPVPQVLAFGQRDGRVYQIQRFVQGQKLHRIWSTLPPETQNEVVAELASYLRILHRTSFEHYGCPQENAGRYDSWLDFWTCRFEEMRKGIEALHTPMNPGLLELAMNYFAEHKHVLRGGAPSLVHGDLWPGNILVENGRIVAILDFEFAIHAPKDYELARIEEFCLYPNDYAEEDNEVYCVADWTDFFQLFQRHDPELFAIEHLRERLNLYHLIDSLHSYVDGEEDDVGQTPATSPEAIVHTMARVANFVFDHGVRMFL